MAKITFGSGAGGGSGFTPQVFTVLGAATGSSSDVTGVYTIPAQATLIMFEVQAGGGGGGSGSNLTGQSSFGAGGGGGGGRSVKWALASQLRAQYPGGIPYTVGHGGLGAAVQTTPTSNGLDGGVGGYTFCGDFVAAVPGNATFPAKGGGVPGNFQGWGGSPGYGDMQGAAGGLGGGNANFYQFNMANDYTGTGGGYPALLSGVGGNSIVAHVDADGGGGGGGGGGGFIVGTVTAYGGGPSGFGITANPSPLAGTGGVVGGAGPGTAGAPAGLTAISVQGGGGGGAATAVAAANGQRGADAGLNSGSGGGGGGNAANGGNGGGGGNGGSGWLRIVAY